MKTVLVMACCIAATSAQLQWSCPQTKQYYDEFGCCSGDKFLQIGPLKTTCGVLDTAYTTYCTASDITVCNNPQEVGVVVPLELTVQEQVSAFPSAAELRGSTLSLSEFNAIPAAVRSALPAPTLAALQSGQTVGPNDLCGFCAAPTTSPTPAPDFVPQPQEPACKCKDNRDCTTQDDGTGFWCKTEFCGNFDLFKGGNYKYCTAFELEESDSGDLPYYGMQCPDNTKATRDTCQECDKGFCLPLFGWTSPLCNDELKKPVRTCSDGSVLEADCLKGCTDDTTSYNKAECTLCNFGLFPGLATPPRPTWPFCVCGFENF